MSEQPFKLNRIQRRAYIRQLQSIVMNQRESGSNASYSLEQRKEAAEQLMEFGNHEDVMETFTKQLASQDEDDAEFNIHIMNIMRDGFRVGLEGVGNGDDD